MRQSILHLESYVKFCPPSGMAHLTALAFLSSISSPGSSHSFGTQFRHHFLCNTFLATWLLSYHQCLAQFLTHIGTQLYLTAWMDGVGRDCKLSPERTALGTGSLPLGPRRPPVVCVQELPAPWVGTESPSLLQDSFSPSGLPSLSHPPRER